MSWCCVLTLVIIPWLHERGGSCFNICEVSITPIYPHQPLSYSLHEQGKQTIVKIFHNLGFYLGGKSGLVEESFPHIYWILQSKKKLSWLIKFCSISVLKIL